MNPNPAYGNKWAAVLGDDFKRPQEAVQALAGQDDAKFYARFLYDFTVEWMWDDSYPTQGTIVRLTHPDLDETINVHPTSITSEALLDENDQPIGTRYEGTATCELNGFTYAFTSVREVLPNLGLSDTSDNTEELESNNGRIANVTLSGRTLYKDGSWNTLCLPFDMTLSGSVLDGDNVDVRTLSSTEYANGTLTLNFTETGAISELKAGTPYIIKWGNNSIGNLSNPTFENVTIKNIGAVVSTDYMTFIGSFSPVGLAADNNTVLYLGDGNQLYYPSNDMTVNACRAIFVLKGLTAGTPNDQTANPQNDQVRTFVLNFGEESTGMTEAEANSSRFTLHSSRSVWFDLNGRKLSGKPTAKGLYIHNGRKAVIK